MNFRRYLGRFLEEIDDKFLEIPEVFEGITDEISQASSFLRPPADTPEEMRRIISCTISQDIRGNLAKFFESPG